MTGDVRKVLGRIMSIAQDHYPETMGETIIINAPVSFRMVWSVVKGMLQPRTVNKITLLGPKFMDELSRRVDPKHVPSYLGGECPATLLEDPGARRAQRARTLCAAALHARRAQASSVQRRSSASSVGGVPSAACARGGSTRTATPLHAQRRHRPRPPRADRAGPWNDERNFTDLRHIEERESDEGGLEMQPSASAGLGKVDSTPKRSVLALGSERGAVRPLRRALLRVRECGLAARACPFTALGRVCLRTGAHVHDDPTWGPAGDTIKTLRWGPSPPTEAT